MSRVTGSINGGPRNQVVQTGIAPGGTFTCPVTGRYLVFVGGQHSSGVHASISFGASGSTVGAIITGSSTTGTFSDIGAKAELVLQAGEVVTHTTSGTFPEITMGVWFIPTPTYPG